MKILITGMAGFMGSCLQDWINTNIPDVEVVGIDDLSGGYIENVQYDSSLFTHDLTNSVVHLFDRFKPDYVFHMAAYAPQGLSHWVRTQIYQRNLVSTSNVINACINCGTVKRLVFTSTSGVYGSHPHFDYLDESMVCKPEDPYGISKLAAEMEIKSAANKFGLDWCILRPHNVYGPKQNIWDRYRNVIGIWMNQTMNNEPMTIYGSGDSIRSFTYIDDVLEPIWNSASQTSASNQIINIGGNVEITIRKLAQIVSDVTGNDQHVYLEPRYEVKRVVPTWQKSENILEYEHRTELKQGIQKMWDWVVSNKRNHPARFAELEITRDIYSYWDT